MRKYSILAISLVAALSALTLFSGCQAATPASTATPDATQKPAVSAAASDKAAATATPQATAKATPAATPKAQAGSLKLLKYYNAVTLGMTNDEVAKATGLTAQAATGQYDPEGAFNYADADGYGVYILFNSSNKAYSKTALKRDYAEDIAPLTAKPVTEDQCNKITKGMSKEDVAKQLGGDGVELSSTATKMETIESIGTILYWANSDGSGIQVVFLANGTASSALFFQ